MSLREMILCADDYGQNEPISQGILELALNKRINAISCLVNTPYWQDAQRHWEAFPEIVL